MFMGGLAVLAVILSVFSTLKTGESVGRNKDSSRLNVLNTNTDEPTPTTAMKESNGQPPKMTIDKTKKYTAIMDTSEGMITIELNAEKTPITVNNFVTLARKGFYDSTIFHRIIKGFMIQGGDPEGTGRGGPGYKFDDEPFDGEYTRGTIAMANAGPNTNGSQFFIMHKDTAQLPKNYVIFGKVTDGLDVVDKIAEAPVTMSDSGEQSKPKNPVTLKSVTIKESDGAQTGTVSPTQQEEPSPTVTSNPEK